MRVVIKGGVWRNTEDEILKAAISKYGKNQWARISSLLVRKTPKQCKARWYEWLDPSIKKTEWSKEEDEKLLHLAKIMPTQWRTTAQLVGRTATQCLERYQQLLDDAESRENNNNDDLGLTSASAEAGPSAEDVRRLRPGEVDPDPEYRPARPDPVDMDEDEKEMLSEARARLANTQGKKAKRKARERQLEEARRLAMLQKRREMKAAGIQVRQKNKRKGMDYMADIPFEKQPPPGFYDTADEDARMARTRAPVGKTIRQMDGKRKKDDDDEAERKKREKKAQEAKNAAQAHFQPEKDLQIQRLKEAEQISKRRKLDLPAAQVGESELDEIVKLGHAGQSARELVDEGANEAGQSLLNDYSAIQDTQNIRTPATQSRGPIAATPNPLARAGGGQQQQQTPMRTPMRDSLKINAGQVSAGGPDETPMQHKRQGSLLKQKLSSLPKPKNDFELVDPEDEQEQEQEQAQELKQKQEEIEAQREEKYLDEAKSLVNSELGQSVGFPGATSEQLARFIASQADLEAFDKAWKPLNDLAYDAQSKSFVPTSTLSTTQRAQGLEAQVEAARERFTKENHRVAKFENKLGKILGGYQTVATNTRNKARTVNESYTDLFRDLESLRVLAMNEQAASSSRLENLRQDVSKLELRERHGQDTYKNLNSEKEQLMSIISAGEEELVLREAEAANEAALAAA